MASLDILRSNRPNFKNKIRKIEHEKTFCGPSKIFEKYFMAHQYMPKIFHDLHNPTLPPSSYVLNVRSLRRSEVPKSLRLLSYFNAVFENNL